MNKHLSLVIQSWSRSPGLQAGSGKPLSDMDIIRHQARLMHEGSHVLIAVKDADMAAILLGLVRLSHCALSAVAAMGGDVIESSVDWQHDGYVISIARLLSAEISQCSSGARESYSQLYALCVVLAKRFINADFDRAFALVCSDYENPDQGSGHELDLSDCLYE